MSIIRQTLPYVPKVEKTDSNAVVKSSEVNSDEPKMTPDVDNPGQSRFKL